MSELVSNDKTEAAAQNLQEILLDDTKKVIVVTGPGGCWKSTMCQQAAEQHPGVFVVYHGDESLNSSRTLSEMIREDTSKGRRVLVCRSGTDTRYAKYF